MKREHHLGLTSLLQRFADSATGSRVLVIGDATLDIFPPPLWPQSYDHCNCDHVAISPGGTGLNVAVGLARLGHQVSLMATFSRDCFGDFLSKCVVQARVDIIEVCRSELATRIVFVFIGPQGERTFVAVPEAAADETLKLLPRGRKALPRVDFLFVTGAVLRIEPAKSSILKLLSYFSSCGVPIALDLNIRSNRLDTWAQYRNALLKVYRMATIVLGTEGEFKTLSYTARDRRQERIIIIKRGKRGCTFGSASESAPVSGFAVDAVDSTGAGDSFDAAFLRSYMLGIDTRNACRIANAAGAFACTIRGSSNALPTPRDIAKVLRRGQL